MEYNETQWTFNDGQRTVDYVLVWDESSSRAASEDASVKRRKFEANLEVEGLELEYEFIERTGLHFVKIHVPVTVLEQYAEILELRLPVKYVLNEFICGQTPNYEHKQSLFEKFCSHWFKIKSGVFAEWGDQLIVSYCRDHSFLFDIRSEENFAPAQKGRIARFILERTLYHADNELTAEYQFGISRLVLQGVYDAAYLLHENDWRIRGNLRYKLHRHWASFKNCCKMQPTDQIKQYFGARTALYFTWLGYYTCMLIPAAIIGVACFVISLILLHHSSTIDDVCDGKFEDVMCPRCDYYCGFIKVTDECYPVKLLYVFDNATTVIFAIFISIWAAGIFQEFWKRHTAKLALRWDMTSLDDIDENPRPEYAARLSKLDAGGKVSHRLNFITNAMEPEVSFWKHLFPGKLLSFSSMLLMVSMVVATVLAVTLYHMFAYSMISVSMFASITATCLNLAFILIFSPIYEKWARYLTNLEMPRTQNEFDHSLTIKIYVLEFINNYASIFYIAFFKGNFTGTPSRYNRIFGFRQVECGIGGCMFELAQQLVIIMIGKRTFRSIVQVLMPVFKKALRRKLSMLKATYRGSLKPNQWEQDYHLSEPKLPLLLPDCIDMVIQYGFLTIFGAAFPLTPLFALIFTIFKIRIDAQKYLLHCRRPTMRPRGIAVWYNILIFISFFAIFSNGFIIAFTSNFVPKLVYSFTESANLNTGGYLNYSLSYISIQDLDMKGKPEIAAEYCRYFDFKEPPWSKHKYETTTMFWIVLAARIAFFVVFENVVLAAVIIIKWLIPDIPHDVEWQMRRRRYLLKEIIMRQ